eukprot:362713-Chlamydomonas_euryale.AAC.11
MSFDIGRGTQCLAVCANHFPTFAGAYACGGKRRVQHAAGRTSHAYLVLTSVGVEVRKLAHAAGRRGFVARQAAHRMPTFCLRPGGGGCGGSDARCTWTTRLRPEDGMSRNGCTSRNPFNA